MRGILKVLPAVGLVLVFSACGRAAPSVVHATVAEMSISLDTNVVSAGEVRFIVRNVGAVEHEVVVIKTDVSQDKIGPGDEPDKVSEDGSVGEVDEIAPGTTKSATLTLPAGKYVLICNEPGHYAAGMHTALVAK